MGLMQKLTSGIVASSLVFGLVGSVFAEGYTPTDSEKAAARMKILGLIQGDQNGNLNLDSNITRAELVKIIVMAYGQGPTANYMINTKVFDDTVGHWGNGFAAVAKGIIESKGHKLGVNAESTLFNPNGNVTAFESVAFLVKFLGVSVTNTGNWTKDHLDAAVRSGILAAEDRALLEGIGNAPMTRRHVFYVSDRAFYSFKTANGKSLYATNVDPTAPELTVDPVQGSTTSASTTVSGSTSADVQEVMIVNSATGKRTTAPVTNGKFSATIDLGLNATNNITVVAKDLAGNSSAERTVEVNRTAGVATSITAEAITVAAGGEATVTAVVKDKDGNVLANPPLTGESTVGTYANGKFTAGTKAGSGTLSLKSGDATGSASVTVSAGVLTTVTASKAAVAPGEKATLLGTDAHGNTVTGVTFSQTSADALVDSNSGAFVATKSGSYTVTATKDGKSVTGKVNVFGVIKNLLVEAPAGMVANEETEYEIKVKAVDANNVVVTSFDVDNKDYHKVLMTTATQQNFSNVTNVEVGGQDGVATFKVKVSRSVADAEIDLAFEYDDTSSANDDADGTGTAVIAGQVATSFKVEAPEYLPTNDRTVSIPAKITVLDQKGEDMLEGVWSVTATLSGSASFKDDENDKEETISVNSTGNINIFPNEAGDSGTATLTIAFPGITTGTDTIKAAFAQEEKAITFKPSDDLEAEAAAAPVEADDDQYVKFNVRVVDKSGVPVNPTTEPANLNLSFEGIASDDKDTVRYSFNNGASWNTVLADDEPVFATVDGKATVYIASKLASSFKVSVKDGDADLTNSGQQTVAVKAGDAAKVGFSTDVIGLLRSGSSTKANVTAQLYDQFGNKVAKSGVQLTFADSADNSSDYQGFTINGKEEDVKLFTDANGAATVEVELQSWVDTSGEPFNLTVAATTDNDIVPATGSMDAQTNKKAYGGLDLSLNNTVATTITAVTVDSATGNRITSWEVGSTDGIALRVTVKDNNGRPVNGLVVGNFTLTDDSSDFTWPTSVATAVDTDNDGNFDDGVYDLAPAGGLKPTEAQTLTLSAKVKGTAVEVKASRAIVVKAGLPNAVIIAEASSNEMVIADKKVTALTIQVIDGSGNVVSAANVKAAINVALTSDADVAGTYHRFQDASGLPFVTGNVADVVQIKAGTNSKVIYFVTDNDGTYTINLNATNTNTGAMPSFQNGGDEDYALTVNP